MTHAHALTAAVVAARSYTMRRTRRLVTRYELRVYGGQLGPSPYRRRRRDGTNPVVIAVTTSGHGIPRWMRAAALAIRAAGVTSVEEATALAARYYPGAGRSGR